MSRILRCDWLPERAGWCYLARSKLPAVSREKIVFFFYVINPLLNKLVRSGKLYIGPFIFLVYFMDLESVSVRKQAKKRTWPAKSSHLGLTLSQ